MSSLIKQEMRLHEFNISNWDCDAQDTSSENAVERGWLEDEFSTLLHLTTHRTQI